MKLIDVLARDLKEWPWSTEIVGQGRFGRLHLNHASEPSIEFSNAAFELADDWQRAHVTRTEWQAAVDALNKPTWNGEGLPPVGTVCEYSVNGGRWFPCEIRYQYRDSEDQFSIIYCPHLQYEQRARHDVPGNCDGTMFRPIRTPEQIAAEERERAVYEMAQDLREHAPHNVTAAFALYDAGYRKQVQP